MLCYRCDRCRKEVSEVFCVEIPAVPIKPGWSRNSLDNFRYFDLCKDCREAFDRFMATRDCAAEATLLRAA